jgi:hypothetical protein
MCAPLLALNTSPSRVVVFPAPTHARSTTAMFTIHIYLFSFTGLLVGARTYPPLPHTRTLRSRPPSYSHLFSLVHRSSGRRSQDRWECGGPSSNADTAAVMPASLPRAYRGPRASVRSVMRQARSSSAAHTPPDTPHGAGPELRPTPRPNGAQLQPGPTPRPQAGGLQSPRGHPPASPMAPPPAVCPRPTGGGPRPAQGAGVGGGLRTGEAEPPSRPRIAGSTPRGANEAGGAPAPSWQTSVIERLIETFTTPLRYLDEIEPRGRANSVGSNRRDEPPPALANGAENHARGGKRH